MKNFLARTIRTGLKIVDRSWFYPVILLFIGLAAYGIIFSRPGFYWDDWAKVHLYYVNNPSVALHYFPTRPGWIWIYLFLFSFVKMTPIVWQFVALLITLAWDTIHLLHFKRGMATACLAE